MAAIIFDFDGTIADSFDYVSDFLVKETGQARLTNDQKQALRGMSMAAMVRQLGFHWWDGPRLFVKGRRQMRRVIRQLDTFSGMPALIRKLHAEGHQLFILSTNSPGNVRRFLHRHRIYRHFLEIYGNVGVFGKAGALRDLLRHHNLEVKEAVYVGDELRDVQAAQSIGLRAVAVSWGFAHRGDLVELRPDGLADTPKQLMSILEEL